ncbi:hypothetical protein GQF03_17465 [Sneathiella chungangensis]|uniref:Transmembrane protein n=1 Tax=Sneathiella chungangensis TaxID=1418234 RepID=A0A845MM25_9PROT|nr:hypothetical protein [Sneathiella chungangensis]MZR24126.1 hypothetical protein [Sneathiella chungangensis]
MKICEAKEFELLVSSIEEVSKHSRNLVFALVVSSIYILITAYSPSDETELTLPAVGVKVTKDFFFAGAPLILLGIYTYLHIYVNQLAEKLRVFDQVDFEVSWVSDSRNLLFPWLLIFSNFPNDASEDPEAQVDVSLQEIALPTKVAQHIINIVSFVIVWILGPTAMGLLWIQYVVQQQTTSLIPCLCFLVSMLILFSRFGEKRLNTRFWIIVSGIFLLFTMISVSGIRQSIGLDNYWNPLRFILIAYKDVLELTFEVLRWTFVGIMFIGSAFGDNIKSALAHMEEIRTKNGRDSEGRTFINRYNLFKGLEKLLVISLCLYASIFLAIGALMFVLFSK